MRWALLENPRSLSVDQRSTPAGIQATNGPLYRAWLLKEQLRAVFQARDLTAARRLLIGWLAWAQRCRLPAFARLTKTIKKFRQLILKRRGARPVQRPLRGHQHPPAPAHPPLLRPEPRVPHGHGQPHPQRPLPTPPQTIMKINPQKRQESLDGAVEIPMIGTGTSLNVAVAGSPVLYKLAGLS